ncbi:hypothetical protein OG259_40710 [Streptomyces sp. NBC_00250]|uniref:hypothetical protein n=1 Tax=Streptomyces sp. NBC_00250 TaxID=2903641 RepID=UPI002E2D485C|nr:hypothetical protein [Streptomyces sp. NBC_00250]
MGGRQALPRPSDGGNSPRAPERDTPWQIGPVSTTAVPCGTTETGNPTTDRQEETMDKLANAEAKDLFATIDTDGDGKSGCGN